jgi:hypothetical protein
MFNMGGPIKQGIMHGIREPYKDGTRAALVGNPIFPKDKTGRAHHVWNLAIPAVRALAGFAIGQGGKKVTQKAIQEGVKKGLKTQSGTGITAAAPGFWRSAWEGDPMVRSAKWLWRTLKSPTAKGWGQKAAKTVVSPTGALTSAWLAKSFWPDGTPKDDGPPTGLNKPGGYPVGPPTPKPKVLSDAERKAFATKQRNERVEKYLALMGYDRSKKTAIADALIDASKIVGERGTLDPKNITQELINPIIQATSKRLDKPQQIREAVGLMMTKAGLEKEMYEAKPGTVLKNVQDMVKSGQYTEKEAWAIATKEPRGPSDVITSHMASKRGSLDAEDLAIIMRDYGAKNDVPVGVITKSDIIKEYGEGLKEYPSAMEIITDKKITDDGIYVIGKEVIQITGGKPLQLA